MFSFSALNPWILYAALMTPGGDQLHARHRARARSESDPWLVANYGPQSTAFLAQQSSSAAGTHDRGQRPQSTSPWAVAEGCVLRTTATPPGGEAGQSMNGRTVVGIPADRGRYARVGAGVPLQAVRIPLQTVESDGTGLPVVETAV